MRVVQRRRNIFKITLPPAEHTTPGQTVECGLPDEPDVFYPFSIASSPGEDELSMYVWTPADTPNGFGSQLVKTISEGKPIDLAPPSGNTEVLQQKVAIMIFAPLSPRHFMTLTPSVSIMKSYMKGGTTGLPAASYMHLIVHDVGHYEWLITCLEDYLDQTLPLSCSVTVHCPRACLNKLPPRNTPLEQSFQWDDKDQFEIDVPSVVEQHKDSTIGVSCIAPTGFAQYVEAQCRGAALDQSPYTKVVLFPNQFGFVTRNFGAPPPKLPALKPWKIVPWDWLFYNTDPCNLAVFRLLFGIVIFLGEFEKLSTSKVNDRFLFTDVRFPYDYWEWVPTLQPPWIYVHFAITCFSALTLGLGWFYRWSAIIFTFSYAWEFFYDSSTYNNHYYLIIIVGCFFCLTDPHNFGVVDFRRLFNKNAKPTPVKPIPYWHLWLFKFMVTLVYFYGSLAKMNYDWVRGYPMRVWIRGDTVKWLIPVAALFLSWGGLMFDFFIGWMLVWEVTRPLAYLGTCYFHVSNHFMFSIGVFPYLMLATNILYADTHFARMYIKMGLVWVADKLKKGSYLEGLLRHWVCLIHTFGDEVWESRFTNKAQQKQVEDGPATDHTLVTIEGSEQPESKDKSKDSMRKRAKSTNDGQTETFNNVTKTSHKKWTRPSVRKRQMVYTFLIVFCAYQILMPFRHFVFHWGVPNQQVSWSENGHRYSWHMMLRHKDCGGSWLITNSLNQTIATPSDDYPLPIRMTAKQQRKQWGNPTYIRMQAQVLHRYFASYWNDPGVEVRANVSCGLNGGKKQPYIDIDMNLAGLQRPSPFWKFEPHLMPQYEYV